MGKEKKDKPFEESVTVITAFQLLFKQENLVQ